MHPPLQISLCMCLLSGSQAKPPLFLNYQDSIGQYSFGYSEPQSARSEYRASDGVTRGVYSYVDNNGLVQTAEYEAGRDLGFRVRATNLPLAPAPVPYTPEVKAARDQHLRLLDEARRRSEEREHSLAAAEAMRVQAIPDPNNVPDLEAKSSVPEVKSVTPEMKIVVPEEKSISPEAKSIAAEARRIVPEAKILVPLVKIMVPELKSSIASAVKSVDVPIAQVRGAVDMQGKLIVLKYQNRTSVCYFFK